MPAPLSGLRVVDMGWVMVGPMSGRYLADLGAEVIKVESGVRIDPLRRLGPFKDGKVHPERSLSYHFINAGKRGVAVDAKDPRGRDVVRRLARWADVFIESFTPGVAAQLGLGYDELRRENERLVMVSTAILGQTGPHAAGLSGVGTMGAAFAGATHLLGWEDRFPCGPFGPWTDSVAPRFIVASVLAALHRRGRTGQGCHIDVAQAEAGLHFLLPAYYEYAANDTVPNRRGRAGSPLRAPAGIYACRDVQAGGWLAIDAAEPVQWEALRALVGPALDRPEFATLIGRLRHRTLLDEALGTWTRTEDAPALEARLQAAGVPAHAVLQAAGLAGDADLRHDGYYRPIRDEVIGEAEIQGPTYRLDRTPHVETRNGPRIGDSTVAILRDICGFTEAEIRALEEGGVLR